MSVLLYTYTCYYIHTVCIDEIVNNQANYQGYEYDVNFLQYHTLTVMHFKNGEGVC